MMTTVQHSSDLHGTPCAIECRNLTFSRRGTEILHGIDFQVPAGGITGLLGKNGAGKSTTINLLMGFLMPDAGESLIAGYPSQSLPPEIRADIGLLHEGFIQYDFMTIREVETFYRTFYPAWDSSVFWDLVNRMKVPHTRAITQLSCGQRSQVTLGLILAQRASVLILDDFSLGLDVGYRRLFLEFLRDYVTSTGATVLLTSHVVSELAAFLDHVILFSRGRIIFNGSTGNFLQNCRGYTFPRTEETDRLEAEEGTVNVEHGAREVSCFSTLSDDAFDAWLAARLPASVLRQRQQLTLSFEDAFVGLTGRY